MTDQATATDKVLAAIERQDLACTLQALRSHCEREGLWDDARHEAEFDAKMTVLSEVWK